MKITSSKISNFFYLGASKLVLCRVDFSRPQEPKLIFFEERPSEGFYFGKINDLELASRQVMSLLEKAELNSFPELTIILSHPGIKGHCFSSSIFYSSPKKQLMQEELDEVVRQTRNVSMVPLKETILQSIPQEYWVNDARGILNPIGKSRTAPEGPTPSSSRVIYDGKANLEVLVRFT